MVRPAKPCVAGRISSRKAAWSAARFSAASGSKARAPASTPRWHIDAARIANLSIIAPMPGRLLGRSPGISVEIVTHDGLVDIAAEGFDAGIRNGRRLSPGMASVPIGPVRRFAVVGAPGYLAANGRPHLPADLDTHRCIGRRFPDGANYAWEFRRDGAGPAFAFEELVAAALCCGCWRIGASRSRACHLYYPGRRLVPAPLRAVIDRLRQPPPGPADPA